jgi:type IV fimbrial biogenesis protein FimT
VHAAQGRPQAGTSLIEQIMVLAVVATLAGLALPPLARLLHGQRLQSAQLDYIAALRYARGAAVMGNTRILLCPSADGRRCGDPAAWRQGWLIARDHDRDGQPDGAPLRAHRLDGRLAVLGTAGRSRVRFLPDGSAGGSNLSLVLCERGDPARALRVVVANSGRVRGDAATPDEAAACAALPSS